MKSILIVSLLNESKSVHTYLKYAIYPCEQLNRNVHDGTNKRRGCSMQYVIGTARFTHYPSRLGVDFNYVSSSSTSQPLGMSIGKVQLQPSVVSTRSESRSVGKLTIPVSNRWWERLWVISYHLLWRR